MSYNPAYGAPSQPQQGYPGQPLQYGYPGQTSPPTGYPGQQAQYGYPGQVPQAQQFAAAAAAAAAQQAFPGQQVSPGYSGPAVDPNVFSWFKAVDQDNSGHINAPELSRALQNGNRCNFSEEACRLMISMFDTDHSGTINVQEFSQLFQYINQWTTVYRRFDQDNSGTIDERELGTALQQMGYRLSPQFVSYLVNKFNPRDRKVGLDHFIIANVQLHRLTEAFKKKDTQMKGVVTMTYEEFMTFSLSV